jgi:hypothetical protein
MRNALFGQQRMRQDHVLPFRSSAGTTTGQESDCVKCTGIEKLEESLDPGSRWMAGIHRRTIVSAAPSFGIKLEGPAKDERRSKTLMQPTCGYRDPFLEDLRRFQVDQSYLPQTERR